MAVTKITNTGVTGLTISSAGRVAMGNTTEIDMWFLPSEVTSDATITAWTRANYTGYAKAGTGMTHNSGIFTFPSTGLYKVSFSFRLETNTSDTSFGCTLDLSTNTGSSFTTILGSFENRSSNSSAHIQALLNITNISTHQIRFVATGLASGSKVFGDSSWHDTKIIFERITDSQQE